MTLLELCANHCRLGATAFSPAWLVTLGSSAIWLSPLRRCRSCRWHWVARPFCRPRQASLSRHCPLLACLSRLCLHYWLCPHQLCLHWLCLERLWHRQHSCLTLRRHLWTL